MPQVEHGEHRRSYYRSSLKFDGVSDFYVGHAPMVIRLHLLLSFAHTIIRARAHVPNSTKALAKEGPSTNVAFVPLMLMLLLYCVLRLGSVKRSAIYLKGRLRYYSITRPF